MRAGKSHTTTDLESDLYDARRMARLSIEFITRGLDFDRRGAITLSEEDAELLIFVVMRTCLYIEAAEELFHKERD